MSSEAVKEVPESVFDDEDDEDFLKIAESIEASQSSKQLTEAERLRVEKNRQKALDLKKARLLARPDQGSKRHVDPLEEADRKKKKTAEVKLVDTNAGFFIEEDEHGPVDGIERELEREPAPVLEPDRPTCLECREELADSFLFRTFDYEVCDKCKDTEKDGKHELITRTDIKNTFLLRDHDIDQREPILKFILKKNPHNPRWGDMKLYLRVQVEKRALEVWGNEEALEAEHEKREEKKDQAKSKKFAKKLKALRMQVRGSLYKKDVGKSSASHEHDFGEESYDEDEDMYSKTCKICGYVQKYEKM